MQQAIGFDSQRGDAVSVVNAPFARDIAQNGQDEGVPLWEHPRAMEFLRIAVGGLAVLVLILAVLRPMLRQLLGVKPQPKKSKVTEATIVPTEEEDIPVALSAPSDAAPAALPPGTMTFDDKLEVARAAVSNDSKRVAQVVRDWVESDG